MASSSQTVQLPEGMPIYGTFGENMRIKDDTQDFGVPIIKWRKQMEGMPKRRGKLWENLSQIPWFIMWFGRHLLHFTSCSKGFPPFRSLFWGWWTTIVSQEIPFFLPWFMFPVNTLFPIPWFIMTLSGHRGLPHFDTRSSVKHGTLEDLSKLSEILRGFTTNHGHFLCDWLVDVESNIILGFLNTNGFYHIYHQDFLDLGSVGGNENPHFAGQLPDRGNRGHLRGGQHLPEKCGGA